MKALILCGGQGTRIRDVSEVLPKPMLPIGERPILWHIMKIYAHYGIKDFILCLGYKGWLIKEFFLNYRAKIADVSLTLGEHNALQFYNSTDESDWRVTLVETGERSQTGARVWNVKKYLEGEEHFCLTYGDGVANINIASLLDIHKKSGLAGTITAVHPLGRFGEMEIKNNRICEFAEKPNVGTGRINGGFMVFDINQVWDYFRAGEDLILEGEVLPRMVNDGQLGAFEHDGFWQCVDTPREYNILNELWKEDKAPWKVW